MSLSTPEGPPGTPPSSDSAQRPLRPRNDHADADTSAQRKRPRLDSGARAHHNMSAEPSGPEGSPQTPPKPADSPAPALTGTPSRVTINVRPPAQETSPVHSLAQETESVSLRSQQEATAPMKASAELEPSSTPVAAASTPVTSSSPEIEVAGPEDMDGSNSAVWVHPLDMEDADDNFHNLMEDFPYLTPRSTCEDTLDSIKNYLVKTDNTTSIDILSQLTAWLHRYLNQTERAADRWFELCSETREFWDAIPSFVDTVLHKAAVPAWKQDIPSPGGTAASDHVIHPGPAFLQAYARLTARMLLMDHRTLQETADDSTVRPDLMSPAYMSTIARCIRTPPEFVFLKMLDSCGIDIDDVVKGMLQHISSVVGQSLDFLTHHMLYLLNRAILEGEALRASLEFAKSLVAHWIRLADRPGETSIWEEGQPALVNFITHIHARLLDLIRQQRSSLRLDHIKSLVNLLTRLIQTSIVNLGFAFPDHTPDGYDLASLPFQSTHRAFFVNASWSMTLFEACITKGHMDARTYGIEGMSELLLETWNGYLANNLAESSPAPVVQYLADFIQHHQLVRYLVIVGSHRQLVTRSSRIIAFLLVTHRYSDHDTDTIWTALRNSQDPRAADSIAEMAQGLLLNMRYPHLLYLLGKFQELPTTAFDTRLRALCLKVVHQFFASGTGEHATAESNMELASLFVRILQELYIERDLAADQRTEIRKFALHQLRQVNIWATPIPDRMVIFAKCFHEIANASLSAYGSASVVMVLLEDRPLPSVKEDVLRLEAEFGMTQKIIEDISQLTSAKAERVLEMSDFHDLLGDHLSLLTKIIVYLPQSITPALTELLWANLVGRDAVDNLCRAKSWTTLSNAIGFCGSEHRDLIERLAHVHFPALESDWYTLETLAFADRVANYDLQFRRREADAQVADRPLITCYNEIHWSIALSTTNQDIAIPTIDNIVHRQLKGAGIVVQGSDNDRLQGHSKFVERTVEHVIHAAREFKSQRDGADLSEDENAIILASQQELALTKIRFQNSLNILFKFVELVRSKSPISPRPESVKSGGASTLPGEKITIRYQAHAAGKTFSQSEFEIGDLATFQNLYDILLARTGFNKLKVIAGGAAIDLSGNLETTIRDIPNLHRGLVLVQKLPGNSTPRVLQLHARLSPLEEEVMRHFYKLYELLDLDPVLGKEVFDFLSSFPPHPDILANVCDYTKSPADMFPPGSSFKGLYGIYALQTSLNTYLQQGVSAVDILAHGIRNISAAILTFDSSTSALVQPGSVSFVTAFVEALLAFLKEPVPTAVSASYFEQPGNLIDQLAVLVNRALELDVHAPTMRLIDLCFKVILEASLHRPDVRAYIASKSEIATMMKRLILESPHLMIRDTTRLSLDSLFAALGSTAIDVSADYYSFFWGLLEPWISDAAGKSNQAQQFFTIASCVFQNLSDNSRVALPLATYREQWSRLLCGHKNSEYVGQFWTDWVVLGLSSLLHWCIILSKNEPSLQLDDRTVNTLFWELLFSRGADRDCLSIEAAEPPVLDPNTRARLYRLILSNVTDSSRLLKMTHLCQEVVRAFDTSNAWTWGYARLSLSADDYNENRSFERRTAIRAPTGYAGLRNLSNTCYLNSLCTQLFMNVEFRSFVLSISPADPWGPQKLVYEMKRLFSYLQHTWLHAVDPEPIADVIVTYEGTPIDVSIQMDVDEFYNLLFDRIESQIKDPLQKQTFRTFYGGQLVQQIKSKDCEHISERLEPFSAIQCEIQGKSNLLESLSAYVEGETMDGDNKYSCSSCGSYVNAIKRACLKDVPNNLIFHLKRFDYDLATGTRSKINEYFEFPFEIDMAPYNIEYLKDTSTPPTPDMFVLVGVLVHTGQAEAGHYYSYIRDRSSRGDVWFEFNDSEVTSFDPANMPSACFGGGQESTYGNEPWLKPWSAYMLFYRRRSVFMDTRRNSMALSRAASRVPTEIADRIRGENEQFIQKYCMFDDEHGNFAISLLEKHLHSRETSACSDDHEQEQEVAAFALQYLDQIFSRQKDSKHALPMLGSLRRMAESCPDCLKVLLDRLIQYPETLQSLLVKCPMESVRQATSDFASAMLRSLRETDPAAYGISSSTALEDDAGCILRRFLEALSWVQDALYEAHKGWDDFYGLLYDIAIFGSFEASMVRETGFLLHCLQLLGVNTCKALQRTLPGFAPFLKASERRHFSLLKLIHLAEYLIREAESTSEASSNDDENHQDWSCSMLERKEEALLARKIMRDSKGSLAVLEAVFRHTKDDMTLTERFVATLVNSGIGERYEPEIARTIAGGLTIEPAVETAPWLHGAIGFCEHSCNRGLIVDLVRAVGKEIPALANSGGAIFLEFFQRIRRAHNVHILPLNALFFKKLVLDVIGRYGTALVYYPKADVRIKAMEFYTDIFADRARTEDEYYAKDIEAAALTLGQSVAAVPFNWQGQMRIDSPRVEQARELLRFVMDEFLNRDNMVTEDEDLSYVRQKVEAGLNSLGTLTASSPDEDLLSTATCDSDSGMSDFSAHPVS